MEGGLSNVIRNTSEEERRAFIVHGKKNRIHGTEVQKRNSARYNLARCEI